MTQLITQPAAPVPDRRFGIKFFGVLTIVLGVLAGGLATCMSFGLLMVQARPQQPMPFHIGFAVGMLFYYGLLAVGLVWTGIGAWQLRRWSRPIVLIVGWLGLLVGLNSLAGMVLIFGRMAALTSPAQGPHLPGSAMAIIMTIQIAFTTLFVVVLPAAFVIFFMRRDVRATLEHYDPQPRWTDRCPVPVLGLSLSLLFGAASAVFFLTFIPALPLFGVLVHGPAVIVLALTLAVIMLILARGVYRVAPWAWWAALMLDLLTSINSFVSFVQPNLLSDMYHLMGIPQQQIDTMRSSGMMDSSYWLAFSAVFMLLTLGFLLYVRKFFSPAALEQPPSPSQV